MGAAVKGHVGGLAEPSRITDLGQDITILATWRLGNRPARIGLENHITAFRWEGLGMVLFMDADGHPLEGVCDLVGLEGLTGEGQGRFVLKEVDDINAIIKGSGGLSLFAQADREPFR
jgi:hypothetical protein